jgi:membrane-associated phospholipid phosphatase
VSRRSGALLAAAFALLAVLVAAGAFTHLDQWAIDHLMPGAKFRPHERPPGILESLVPLYGSHWHGGWGIAVNLVTLPGAFLVSFLIVLACSRTLAVALLAAVFVEVLCKEVLERPALHSGAVHIVAFDTSFPSGHTLRAVIVAAAVALAWPRLRVLALAWLVAVLLLLELTGWHTPTDIVGGLLLGGLALLCARAAGALRGRRRLAA